MKIHVELVRALVRGLTKVFIGADPVSIQGESTLVSIFWFWEIEKAVHGLVQIIGAGEFVPSSYRIVLYVRAPTHGPFYINDPQGRVRAHPDDPQVHPLDSLHGLVIWRPPPI